ncbi:hypothetical protein BC332_13205 [Capsicum chinense]|nr:hypothetical protein BC332_13205 [Capsicum chinense]
MQVEIQTLLQLELKKDQTRTDTCTRGTVGYLAPEWLKNAPITPKVDIFSYAVMLLEITCGIRHIELSRVEEESEDDEGDDLLLVNWAAGCMRSGRIDKLARNDPEILNDKRLAETANQKNSILEEHISHLDGALKRVSETASTGKRRAKAECPVLKLELVSISEELKLMTFQRDLSTDAAETASKQQLESVKKVAKLESMKTSPGVRS